MTRLSEIINLDPAIRFVACMDKSGDILSSETRKDVVGHEMLPMSYLEVGATMFRTAWSCANSFSKYFGDSFGVVFHHDKLDLILMEINNKIYAITVEKNVESHKIMRIVTELLNK